MKSQSYGSVNIYLELASRKQGIIYTSANSKGLECFVDANFAGGWSQANAANA